MPAMPADVTIGEVWRGMADIRTELATISVEVRALPATLARELDERSVQRVDALKTEMGLRMTPLENRVARLEKVMWAVIGFVFFGVGTALVTLVFHR